MLDTTSTILDVELYSEAEAARLLGLPTSTLHYWLHGATRGPNTYPPVIRPQQVERRWVTWAEFIEAGWLSAYRRKKHVPMQELRHFINDLRDRAGVPYPLAHFQPLTSGRNLVVEAQTASGLDPDYRLVLFVDQQYLLSYAGERFMEQVVWRDDVAAGWKPAGRESPVTISPDVRFGRPSVKGVSTATLFEQAESGASPAELALDFELTEAEVRWALAFENEQHAAA